MKAPVMNELVNDVGGTKRMPKRQSMEGEDHVAAHVVTDPLLEPKRADSN